MNDKQLYDRLSAYQDSGGPIGADLEFFTYNEPKLDGLVEADALRQLEFFAQTGSGGLYAVWLLPDGRRPVVYFCDEGVDTCLVSASMHDFAKLLAVGYHRFPCAPNELAYRDPDPVNREAVDAFSLFVADLLDCDIPEVGGTLAIQGSPDYPDIVKFLDDAWIHRPQDEPKPVFGERFGKWLGERIRCLLGRDSGG